MGENDSSSVTKSLKKAKEEKKNVVIAFDTAPVEGVYEIQFSTEEAFGFSFKGNRITAITPDSQAARLDVKVDWLILSIDGEKQENDSESVTKSLKKAIEKKKNIEIVFDTEPTEKILQIEFSTEEDFGFSFKGNRIDDITADSQASRLDVKVDWRILSIDVEEQENDTESIRNSLTKVKEEKKNVVIAFDTVPIEKIYVIQFSTEEDFGFSFNGNRITAITPDSQASRLDVQVDWNIFSIDGEKQEKDSESVTKYLTKVKEEKKEIVIAFYIPPEEVVFEADFSTEEDFGFSLKGSRITGITTNSQAARLKIQVNWQILSIDGEKQENDNKSITKCLKKVKGEKKNVMIAFDTTPIEKKKRR